MPDDGSPAQKRQRVRIVGASYAHGRLGYVFEWGQLGVSVLLLPTKDDPDPPPMLYGHSAVVEVNDA